MKKNSLVSVWLWPVLTGLLFIGFWYSLRKVFEVSEWLLPMPHEIIATMVKESTRLLAAVRYTALAALGGFLLAASSGFLISLLLGRSVSLRRSFYPWLLILQMTPVIVLTPIIVIWPVLGSGMRGIMAVTWLISFFPIVVNTTQGLLSTDMNHVALFRMCNASRWQEMIHLRVPAAMPQFLAGLRIAATLAPIGAIFGEYMVGNSGGGSGGLGFLVYSYNSKIMIPALFATGLTSCLLGFVFVAAVSLLNWAVLHKWHDSFEREDH